MFIPDPQNWQISSMKITTSHSFIVFGKNGWIGWIDFTYHRDYNKYCSFAEGCSLLQFRRVVHFIYKNKGLQFAHLLNRHFFVHFPFGG
jgi:hypothetical protein